MRPTILPICSSCTLARLRSAGVLAVAMGSRFFAPEEHRDNWGGKAAIDAAVRHSVLPANALKQTPDVAGETFTAADISMFYALDLAHFLGFRDRLDPVLADYHERLKARPAQQRARARSVMPTWSFLTG